MEHIDKTYVINLERSYDRREHINKELKRFNINYSIFNAIDGNTLDEPKIDLMNIDEFNINKYELGLVKTFKLVINDAIENNYENIIVFEDDILLESEFNEKFEKYFKQLPPDWFICQFSVAIFRGPATSTDSPHRYVAEYINNNIARIERSYGTFALLINKRSFNYILECINDENQPLDVLLINLQEKHKKSFCFYPGLVRPIPIGMSTISGQSYDISWANYIYPWELREVMTI